MSEKLMKVIEEFFEMRLTEFVISAFGLILVVICAAVTVGVVLSYVLDKLDEKKEEVK